MLMDTGASDNYMDIKLVKALGLSLRPVHQNIMVAMADGHKVAVLGTFTVPTCIGRFRAKVGFLVTELDAAFDAVLGFRPGCAKFVICTSVKIWWHFELGPR